MAAEWKPPVIDISEISLIRSESEANTARVQQIAEDLVAGMKAGGVVYLVNHGVDFDLLKRVQKIARDFFSLPNADKFVCHRRVEDVTNGWLGMGMEYSRTDQDGEEPQNYDLKESYNIFPADLDVFPWPSEETLPNFRSTNRAFFGECIELSRRVVKLLDMVLSPDEHTILNAHQKLGVHGNGSHGKILYYPPLEKGSTQAVRLNEHTDWGTFTLFIQDSNGGLEVCDRDGNYRLLEPTEGVIGVQAADMLQRWTSDHIMSVLHRVSALEKTKMNVRESAIYFVTADDGFPIKCLDGSDRYETCDVRQHVLTMTNKFQPDDNTLEKIAMSY